MSYYIAALYGMAEFWSGDHALLMGESSNEIRLWQAEDAYMELG